MSRSPASKGPDLYAECFVWDAHAGFESWPHTDLDSLHRWRRAGVDFLSVNVGYDLQDWRNTDAVLTAYRAWLDAQEDFVLVGTAAEARAAHAAGRMGVAFDLEGTNALDGSLERLGHYHALGLRQVAFAYNRNNRAGGGCHDEDPGLTRFGRSVVREMNRLGMLVDCSHCGYRTTMDMMEASAAPVIFSHSNARALRDHERNITDEQALACAATGGVVGVNGIGLFLGNEDARAAAMADHVEHYLDLMGPDHVGLGLDYFFETQSEPGFNDTLLANAEYWPPEQYPDGAVTCAEPEQLVELAVELDRRGRSERDSRAVLGGNFLRVVEAVWG